MKLVILRPTLLLFFAFAIFTMSSCTDSAGPEDAVEISGRYELVAVNGIELPFSFESNRGLCYEVHGGPLRLLGGAFEMNLSGPFSYDCQSFHEDDFEHMSGQYYLIDNDRLVLRSTRTGKEYPGRVVEDTIFVHPQFVPASQFYDVLEEYTFVLVEEPSQ